MTRLCFHTYFIIKTLILNHILWGRFFDVKPELVAYKSSSSNARFTSPIDLDRRTRSSKLADMIFCWTNETTWLWSLLVTSTFSLERYQLKEQNLENSKKWYQTMLKIWSPANNPAFSAAVFSWTLVTMCCPSTVSNSRPSSPSVLSTIIFSSLKLWESRFREIFNSIASSFWILSRISSTTSSWDSSSADLFMG